MNDFELATLNGYALSIYKTLKELSELELKQENKEYDQILSRLKFSINSEKQIYERIYNENNYQKYIKDDYTLANIMTNIIANNQKFLDDAHIFIRNNNDDIDYGIKIKYLLAYIYPNICSYLIDNNFSIPKDLYWYSYFIKDILQISDDEFYRERILFSHSEYINEYFTDTSCLNHDKSYFCNYISRIISLMLLEDYDMKINDFVDKSKEIGLHITEISAQKLLKTFNEDRNIPKILRLYK